MARRRMTGWLVASAMAVTMAGCGNADIQTPSEVVQNYMSALAEGNDTAACAQLDPATQVALERKFRPHPTCPGMLRRCLPTQAQIINHDQAQLFYATVDVFEQGDRAQADLSGTAVARATRRVTMIRRHGRWQLTSPGEAIRRCAALRRRRHR